AAGLIAGLAFGLVAGASGSNRLVGLATSIEPLGSAFVNLIRMVVVPLVATTVTGVARLGDLRRVGRLGAIALGFFFSTTIVAIVLFGAAAGTLPEASRARLTTLADSVTQALIRMVHWILWIAPFGVFALAAAVTARSGWSMLQNLAVFIGGVIGGLVVFFLG